jgi:ATP-dependent helicase/nuclease subunit B
MTGPMIITANSRLARVLRQDYDRKQIANGVKVWTPPDILPISAWLERSWRSWIYATNDANPVQLLTASQERANWETIVARSDAGKELLQVGPTAEAAASAWSLAHAWKIPFDASDWESARDTEAFRSWAAEFQTVSKKRNWISAARLPDFIASKIELGEVSAPPHVQLAGFAEFTPAQERLLNSLRRTGTVVEILPAPDRGGRQSAVRVGLVDSNQEIRAAARWVRKLLENSIRSGEGEPVIGIVVPELSKYRSTIERVFSEEFHPGTRLSPDEDSKRVFNISLGPALSEYPLIQSALRILRMNPTSAIAFDDATSLLRSPFLGNAQSEATACAELDLQLRRLREPELALSDITSLAPPGLKSALSLWQLEYSKTSGMLVPSEWSAAFSRELKSVGWPGDRPLDSTEYQTSVQWNEWLSEFSGLDASTGGISRAGAISMLQRLVKDEQFQPESEPAPVQILGVFEASGMSFDHLWILGMHDGVWPRSASPNPFLPLRLQRSLGLPQSSPQRELEFTILLTEQLLASASSVVVSHPENEGDAALRPSPLFSSLPQIPVDELELPLSPDYAEQLFRSRNLEKIDDSNAPQWNGAKARGGTSIFEAQAACPFQAFAKVRLGAEKLETPTPGLSPQDRGNLVHDVLAAVWKELGSHQTLITTNAGEISAVIHDSVAACIRELSLKRRALLEPRFAAIEQSRLQSMVSEWLDLEKKRRPFEVVSLETQRPVNIGGIDFTIRADRIDRMDDGTSVVMDYKTSMHGPREWDGDRPDAPQLPLYAVTADVPPAGVVFAVVKTGESRFTGLAASDGVIPGVKAVPGDGALASRVPQWRGVLEKLALDFQSGKALVDPKQPHQTCRTCGMQSLCRIHELNMSDEDVDSPDSEVAND